MEKNGTVVYLGPPATHTHLACIQYFGSSFRTIPKESIQEIFEAVENNEVNFGVAPIENSTEGSINRTLDMFIESEVKIYGEILIRISHDLLSRTGRPEEIQRICSHPQALEQCRKWLKKNFPQALCVETVSTAKAAQIAIKGPNTAAIASAFAAHLYGLNVVAPQIEDYPHNYTRFLVLSREPRGNWDRENLHSFLHIPCPGFSLSSA